MPRRPGPIELPFRVPEAVEEASTVAEQRRDDVEPKFVEQSRRQVTGAIVYVIGGDDGS